jgi:hypothetical protein
MSNGKLIPPDLDDRRWQDLVDEMKGLIPTYAPEWTDHNTTDLGITLIELFAWLMEQTIYRLNRVPEKNYIKFLNLIGVTRDAPTPAEVDMTFTIAGDDVVTIPKGTQVSTPPAGNEDGIIFETNAPLNAVNIKQCLLVDKSNQYENLTAKVIAQSHATVDIEVPPLSASTLLIGLVKDTDLVLSIAADVDPASDALESQWIYSTTDGPANWPPIVRVSNPNYRFNDSAIIHVQVLAGWQPSTPGSWGATPKTPADTTADKLYWLGIHLSNVTASPKHVLLRELAANTTPAINALTIKEEMLGIGTGDAYQVYSLRNPPLYRDEQALDYLGHLVLAVKESATDGWNVWQRVEDFAQGDVRQYRCNPTTGEIGFGNHPTGNPDNPGYGRIPAQGSQIKAVAYRYVAGGENGNLPKNTIVIQRNPVHGVVSVTNKTAASGGTDWEDIEDTKRRGPQTIKIRDRAVTVEDYEYHAKRATTDVHHVRCFPPKKETEAAWVTVPFERVPGKVHLIIVPNDKETRNPKPTVDLITAVKDYLDERRTITSVLVEPLPPYYVEVKVETVVWVKPGQNINAIKQKVQQALFDFFHPVTGGPQAGGWEIGRDLYTPAVFKVIASITEVSYISEMKIGRVGQAFPGGVRLEVEDYELICAAELTDANYAVTVNEEELEL